MNFFNPDAYLALEKEIKQQASSGDENALEDLTFLKKAVLIFAHYVYIVNEEQIETRLAKGVKKGNDLQEVISHFDLTRHTAHDAAIVNVKVLNRIASAYGIGPIYIGDPSNRREVGHFCGEITSWFFENRYA